MLAEDPYAEWFGDREDLALPPSEAQVLERVVGRGVPVGQRSQGHRHLSAVANDTEPAYLDLFAWAGDPVQVVVVLLAGRALTWDWTGVDGVVLAWLPGSEGQGVVDALLEGPSTKA